jgi:hypothetical protein
MPLAELDSIKEVKDVPAFFWAQCRPVGHPEAYLHSIGCPSLTPHVFFFAFSLVSSEGQESTNLKAATPSSRIHL